MILTLAIATLVSATQQINCFPRDPNSPDRMVMSLQLANGTGEFPLKGTLFLSSGVDREGNQDSSDVMGLELLPASADDLKNHSVSYVARAASSNFIVSMSEGDVGKTIESFSVDLILERNSDQYRVTQKMNCYATAFPQ